MKCSAKVHTYEPKNSSYIIRFSLNYNKFNIEDGCAKVFLKKGESTFSLINSEKVALDNECYRYLLNNFLNAIYLFNKEKIEKLRV